MKNSKDGPCIECDEVVFSKSFWNNLNKQKIWMLPLKVFSAKQAGSFQKNNVIKGFCGIRPLKNKLMVIIVKLLGEIKRKRWPHIESAEYLRYNPGFE